MDAVTAERGPKVHTSVLMGTAFCWQFARGWGKYAGSGGAPFMASGRFVEASRPMCGWSSRAERLEITSKKQPSAGIIQRQSSPRVASGCSGAAALAPKSRAFSSREGGRGFQFAKRGSREFHSFIIKSIQRGAQFPQAVAVAARRRVR